MLWLLVMYPWNKVLLVSGHNLCTECTGLQERDEIQFFLTCLQFCFQWFSSVSNLSERPSAVILMGGPLPSEEVVIHTAISPSDVGMCCAISGPFLLPFLQPTNADDSLCRHCPQGHSNSGVRRYRNTDLKKVS